MRSEGFSFYTFGGLGVETCSHDPASGVRNQAAHDRRDRKVGVSMGEATKTYLVHSFLTTEDVVMSFCVASVALCDTPHFTRLTPHSTL